MYDGKIAWGGEPILPHNAFEEEIARVTDCYMEAPLADTIIFAAYLTECVKAYNDTVNEIFCKILSI